MGIVSASAKTEAVLLSRRRKCSPRVLGYKKKIWPKNTFSTLRVWIGWNLSFYYFIKEMAKEAERSISAVTRLLRLYGARAIEGYYALWLIQ